MGFYIRKSVSFGPLRLNISKSGVGASVGIRGLRLGTGPKGNYIHVGRGGLYYKSILSAENTHRQRDRNRLIEVSEDAKVGLTREIESGDLLSIQDSSEDSLLSEIRRKHKKLYFWPFVVGTTVLLTFIQGVFAFLLLLIPISIIVDHYRKRVILLYSIDEAAESAIMNFYNEIDKISDVDRIWHIQSEQMVLQKKYFSGADKLIKRKQISIQYDKPKHMKTNIRVPKIPVGNKTIYLFPDRLLIYDKKMVGSVSYKNLKIVVQKVTIIEEEYVPRDTQIIGHTWKFVNKKGGPDRRFKDNRELPKVEYNQVCFRSESGLNEMIQLSKPDVGEGLSAAIRTLAGALENKTETT